MKPIIIYLIVIGVMSIFSFILYARDKKLAEEKKWRIKEKTLLLSGFLFGSIGSILAMYICRHKTKHWYFVFFNFLFLILHIAGGVLIYLFV